MRRLKTHGWLIAVFVAAAGAGSLAAANVDRAGQPPVMLAQTHAEICAANRDQCLKGCDGMTQCSNQCWTNYDGCMKQGG